MLVPPQEELDYYKRKWASDVNLSLDSLQKSAGRMDAFIVAYEPTLKAIIERDKNWATIRRGATEKVLANLMSLVVIGLLTIVVTIVSLIWYSIHTGKLPVLPI